MKHEITIHMDDEKLFTKHLLIHLAGIIELYNQKTISGDEVWESILLFHPKVKFKGYSTTKRIDHILGLISEIEWSRDDYPQTYPKALKRIRSLLKKEIELLKNISATDDKGYRKISIRVTPVTAPSGQAE